RRGLGGAGEELPDADGERALDPLEAAPALPPPRGPEEAGDRPRARAGRRPEGQGVVGVRARGGPRGPDRVTGGLQPAPALAPPLPRRRGTDVAGERQRARIGRRLEDQVEVDVGALGDLGGPAAVAGRLQRAPDLAPPARLPEQVRDADDRPGPAHVESWSKNPGPSGGAASSSSSSASGAVRPGPVRRAVPWSRARPSATVRAVR